MRIIKLIFTVFLMPIMTLNAASPNKEQIIYATPEWKNFTNKDGSGLYHELIKKIFNARNITVKVKYVPMKRAILMAKRLEADIIGGIKNNLHTQQLQFPKYPIYNATASVLMHKSFLNSWNGIETINALPQLTVGPPALAKSFGINANIQEVSTREQCIRMLKSKRVQYYIDDKVILQSIMNMLNGENGLVGTGIEGQEFKNSKINFNTREYVIVKLIETKLYMAFTKTEKGKKLKRIFDEEIEKLSLNGELSKIYKKWKLDSAKPSIN